MSTPKNLKELDKAWKPFGFRVNEKGELSVIGERDGKEYKIGKVRKRVVSTEEMENFLENSNNQERERDKKIV